MPNGATVQNYKNKSENNDISTIDMPQGMPGVSTNPKDQTEDPFGKFDCKDLAQNA